MMILSVVSTQPKRFFCACRPLIQQQGTLYVVPLGHFLLKLQSYITILYQSQQTCTMNIPIIPRILRKRTNAIFLMSFSLVMRMRSYISQQTRIPPVADHGILFHAYSSNGLCNITNSYVSDIELMVRLYKSLSPQVRVLVSVYL